jgi:DNA mismatch repair protein MutL
VRSRSLVYAVEEAYSGLMQSARYPVAVVDLRLPPEEVDVNVHPAKTEVRLRNERQVFSLVQRPLRRSLAGLAPPGASPASGWPVSFSARSPYASDLAPALVLESEPTQSEMVVHVDARPATSQTALPASLPILRPLGQAGTTYIIAEGPAGLYLIDQHAAHERILFERFLASETQPDKPAQPLLSPALLELTPAQQSLVVAFAPPLREHGFELEPFGPGGYLLRTAPADLRGDDPARAFVDLLELLTREDSPADPRRRVAASLACHAAVRAGQTLAFEEMRDLIRQLEGCDLPQTCPHGRPTMLHLSADELAKRFSRK